MQVVYSQIEQEVVSWLSPLTTGGGVDVVQLPQLQAEFERPFLKGRITIAYKSSDFGDIKNSHHIVQDEKIQIEVIIQSRLLRGADGLHAMTEAVKRRLLGYSPTDCSKMYLAKNGFTDHNNESALWSYSMIFETTYRLVEDAEYNTGVTLEEVFFEYNEELPSIPAIPFPGTYPNPPVINYKGDIAYWDGEVWRRLHPGEPGYVLATMGQGQVPEWVTPQSGPAGEDGQDGLSAYEIAVANGFVGNEAEWLGSLVGADGANGLSAYEVAVENGFVGTEDEWLETLIGFNGLSAYEIALVNGFVGTEQEWLESLVGDDGDKGDTGDDGLSAYQVAVENGYTGTEVEWLLSLRGSYVFSGTAPTTPTLGLIWFNSSTGRSLIWNGTAWVEFGTAYVHQGAPALNYIGRNAYASGVSYCGIAPDGSLESDAVWYITKITVATNGSVTTATASGVNWTDYLTHSYN